MTGDERGGLAIITDLYNLTSDMVKRLNDPDFLAESVTARQKLLDEYDASRNAGNGRPDESEGEMKRMVREILAMDQKINSSLARHRDSARQQMSDIQSKQRALTMAGKFASSQGAQTSGSRMDYTK